MTTSKKIESTKPLPFDVKMEHYTEQYGDFIIQKRIDIKKNSCLIYSKLTGGLIKGVAGDILADGSENSIKKAKQWIDKQEEILNA